MASLMRCKSFDFSPSDFLNDPYVVVMTFEERGAYITLLCRAWEMPMPGILPADPVALRRLVGATPDEWDRIQGALRRCFDTQDGRWVQKRMCQEHAAQVRRVQRAITAGKVAAQARWSKRDKCDPHYDRNAIDLPSSSTSSSTSEEKKEHSRRLKAPTDGDFEAIWKAYPHHGRRSCKAESLRRWRALKNRPQVEVVLAAIDASRTTDDWTRAGGQFVPAMEVWIRKQGWDSSDGACVNGHNDGLDGARRLLAEMEARRAEAKTRQPG